MAARQVPLSPDAELKLDAIAQPCVGGPGLKPARLTSFLNETEGAWAEDLLLQRDRSDREFREGLVVSWSQVKRDNGL
jgi:hypothetical protein